MTSTTLVAGATTIVSLQDLGSIWTDALDLFDTGAVAEGMELVSGTLDQVRRSVSREEWLKVIDDPNFLRVREILHEDPYTHRGFSKPRGYPGDAVLLDYIYRTGSLPDATTGRGRSIYEWCSTNSTAFRGVRARRAVLANAIDEVAASRPKARVLAVACGHLREAALSKAFAWGDIGEVVALDQDPLSLGVVSATYPSGSVTSVAAGIGDLLKRKVDLGSFDLIYAAGLYDYLDDRIGAALSGTLIQMLNPGGRLLVANFIEAWEGGYMEAAMKWFLLYRSLDQLASTANPDGCMDVRAYEDEWGVIGYVEATKP
jgi:extracellular factor (EF) 3-hydroxypalmitic acid methyl ester biosynthesis protein